MLDCYITPMPADTEAELTKEMSVNAIAVAARARALATAKKGKAWLRGEKCNCL